MSFELLETNQVTQNELPPKLASGMGYSNKKVTHLTKKSSLIFKRCVKLKMYEYTFGEKSYICAMKIPEL